MGKVKVSVTIDEELVNWADGEIEKKRFSSRSHAVDYALDRLRGIELPDWYLKNQFSIAERYENHIKDKHLGSRGGGQSFRSDGNGNLVSHVCDTCGEELIKHG